MLRSAFAVIGGYIVFAVGMAVTTAAVGYYFPQLFEQRQPTQNFIAVNLAYAGVMAMLGGYFTGLIAGREPLKHAMVLAAICTLYFLLFLGAPTPPGEMVFPAWYKIGLLVVVPPGMAAGGFIRQGQSPAVPNSK